MSMEDVERCKLPSSCPQKDVIPSTENPKDGQVCVRHDAGPIGDVSPELWGNLVVAKENFGISHNSHQRLRKEHRETGDAY